VARTWLRLNERLAVKMADVLIADHPEIASDLRRRLDATSTMIAYGVDAAALADTEDPPHPLLERWSEGTFDLVIARPEPENQIHLLLRAHATSSRLRPLVLVGNFAANGYGKALLAEHPQAHFVGPVYEPCVLDSLRRRSVLYLHGHSVGGTNPSLIEAMAAGAMVVAHDNVFNRWVLGEGGMYFRNELDLAELMNRPPTPERRRACIAAARLGCQERFLWPDILAAYEAVVGRLSSQ
jgi:glycosyltransferase involved in cell wall biosynthesis